jgi:cytochrome c556
MRSVGGAALLLGFSFAGVAGAEGTAAPALRASQIRQAVDTRQAIYVLTSRSFAPLAATAQGKLAFDGAATLKRAQRLALLAEMAGEAYPAGSVSATSDALPRIWQQWPEFERRLREFSTLANGLVDTLRREPAAGEAFRSKVTELAAACKGCHEQFRADP